MAFAEPGVRIETESLSIAHPFLMPDDSREIQAIQRALHAATGKQALLMRHGGSLAIGGLLAKTLDLPVTCSASARAAILTRRTNSSSWRTSKLATEVAIRLLFELGNGEL